MRSLALLAGLFCLLALPAVADTPMTRLRVEVKNHNGKPIERASVVVRFVQGRSIAKFGKNVITNWEMRTNQEGVARIPSIPQGQIRIQVIAKGYQTFGKTFDVDEEEKTIEIRLNPPQPQYSSHQ
ncbi:MAG TPA: carboxypeptidase-like regulatory domain-containing protein [Bryobacteraceae bacterium]|nr:carboxypeptidase-like regulatory domain-containing protein [Bryobacteraceae bacterium]HPQ16022.1 carboxypeptidase-like regulatory domain-containing protein [Bryobacteraceae bacterium]